MMSREASKTGAALALLLLAGAPGPEVKYLRRWATDADFDVTSRISVGGGVLLGDAPISIDTATLRRFDAVLIDDRSWAGLGGQRNALLAAVRDGLGLILRAGGPVSKGAGGPARWRELCRTLRSGCRSSSRTWTCSSRPASAWPPATRCGKFMKLIRV